MFSTYRQITSGGPYDAYEPYACSPSFFIVATNHQSVTSQEFLASYDVLDRPLRQLPDALG